MLVTLPLLLVTILWSSGWRSTDSLSTFTSGVLRAKFDRGLQTNMLKDTFPDAPPAFFQRFPEEVYRKKHIIPHNKDTSVVFSLKHDGSTPKLSVTSTRALGQLSNACAGSTPKLSVTITAFSDSDKRVRRCTGVQKEFTWLDIV